MSYLPSTRLGRHTNSQYRARETNQICGVKARKIWRISLLLFFALCFAVSLIPLSSASSSSSLKQTPATYERSAGSRGGAEPSPGTRDRLLPNAGMFGLTNEPSFAVVPLLAPQNPTSITFYDSSCMTPKSVFDLGETVCVQVDGVDPNLNARIDWVGASGLILSRGPTIPTGFQTATFSIPLNGNIGNWRVNITSASDGAARASGLFTVRNPQENFSDLSIGNFSKQTLASAGSDLVFLVVVQNLGPDTAQNVSWTDSVPGNATFVSFNQLSGPSFNCTNPTNGQVGDTNCAIATLDKDGSAEFELTYRVNPGTPSLTSITNTATISSDTSELQASNNSASDSVDVFEQPCVVSCPPNITMSTDQDEYSALVNYSNANSSGDCGTLTYSVPSGSHFPVGTTIVAVAGEGGNPCSFTVTINDTQAPVISCPSDISVFESPAGAGSAIVNYSAPSFTDNDPGTTVSCDRASGSSFDVGTTLVTCTATDRANNTASCSFNVTVQSTTSNCSISCPADITRSVDAGSCGAVVTYDAPTADNCDGGTVTQTAGLPSGATFPVGTTINRYSVTDSSGHTSSCSFKVTVLDDVNPTIECPANITVDAAPNSCQANVTVLAPAGQDNCTGVTVAGARDDGDPLTASYPVGSTIITWTATDASGNTASCQQMITVRDQSPPTLSVPATVPGVTADTECQAEIPDISESIIASDNCTLANTLTILQSPAAGTIVGAGQHIITVTAEDSSGNKTTRTTTFTVLDQTPPTITLTGANPLTVECHTSFVDPGAIANDSCAGSFAATASGTVDASVPGTYVITYNASDPSGNAAAPVSRTVNVVDTTPPSISCPANIVVTLPANTTASSMVVNYPAVTASESCSTATIASTPASGSVFPVGTTTVVATATDAAGNSSTCSFTVTVLYNFTGFFSPVSNLPTLNIVNAGKAVPVKFSLSGNKGLDIFAAITNNPGSGVIPCNSNDPVEELTQTVTAGSSSLSYDATSDTYNYVWKTEASWAGSCRQLVLQLNDGSTHRANFKFR